MKLSLYLPILLLGLTNCSNEDWIIIGNAVKKGLIEEANWYSKTPPEREYKLGTGEYPAPYLSEVMRQDYERQKKQEQWFKDAEAKNK